MADRLVRGKGRVKGARRLFRRTTLPRMTPHEREFATLLAQLDSVLNRLKNLRLKVADDEFKARALDEKIKRLHDDTSEEVWKNIAKDKELYG